MAFLIKCYECGEKISDRAPMCPHCGAPKLRFVEDERGNNLGYDSNGILVYAEKYNGEKDWFDNNKNIIHQITSDGGEFYFDYDMNGVRRYALNCESSYEEMYDANGKVIAKGFNKKILKMRKKAKREEFINFIFERMKKKMQK